MPEHKPGHDQVRQRAYALWEQAGRPEGRSEEFWHQASADLEAKNHKPSQEMPENLADEVKPGTVPE